jgi:hypothetical protein
MSKINPDRHPNKGFTDLEVRLRSLFVWIRRSNRQCWPELQTLAVKPIAGGRSLAASGLPHS